MILSFDIELSDVFDLAPNEDIEVHAPFHISTAATAVHGGDERNWVSNDLDGAPSTNLTRDRAHELLEYLEEQQDRGVDVFAWNGLGFDLKWIGHNADDMQLAARVAMRSFDPMFQFFMTAGFPVGLAKVAEAMKVPIAKSMDGADAPQAWRDGRHQEVMDYCMGDCRMTNLVVREIQNKQRIAWVTSKGTISSKPIPKLRPVSRVIEDPDPDQSWMTKPILRTKFYAWVLDALG